MKEQFTYDIYNTELKCNTYSDIILEKNELMGLSEYVVEIVDEKLLFDKNILNSHLNTNISKHIKNSFKGIEDEIIIVTLSHTTMYDRIYRAYNYGNY